MDQKWYQDFVADGNMPREMLFDLLTAANYMGIKALLDLTCLKVTFELTGKNAEQVSVCHMSLLFVVYRMYMCRWKQDSSFLLFECSIEIWIP